MVDGYAGLAPASSGRDVTKETYPDSVGQIGAFPVGVLLVAN